MKPASVRELMSRAVMCLDLDDTIRLGKLSMDLGMIRHMPVTSAGRLVGLVALTDLLQALARAEGMPVAVRTVMQRSVRTVREDAPAYDAAREMLDAKVGCLPVVGEHGELVGIVTEADFVRLAEGALRALAEEHPRVVPPPDDEDEARPS